MIDGVRVIPSGHPNSDLGIGSVPSMQIGPDAICLPLRGRRRPWLSRVAQVLSTSERRAVIRATNIASTASCTAAREIDTREFALR